MLPQGGVKANEVGTCCTEACAVALSCSVCVEFQGGGQGGAHWRVFCLSVGSWWGHNFMGAGFLRGYRRSLIKTLHGGQKPSKSCLIANQKGSDTPCQKPCKTPHCGSAGPASNFQRQGIPSVSSQQTDVHTPRHTPATAHACTHADHHHNRTGAKGLDGMHLPWHDDSINRNQDIDNAAGRPSV